MSFNPDFAISMSFWVNPFDWLPVQDSLIAEKLESIDLEDVKTYLSERQFDELKERIANVINWAI